MPIKMKFYNRVSDDLKNNVNHYWTTAGTLDNDRALKLFPMDHIDLVIPIAGEYDHIVKDGVTEERHQVFFHGMRENAVEMVQQTYVECIGISFKPWGFYPLVKKELMMYQNRYVDMMHENSSLSTALLNVIEKHKSMHDGQEENLLVHSPKKIEALILDIETILSKQIDKTDEHSKTLDLLSEVCNISLENLSESAEKHKISVRTLERMFNRYIGTSPQAFFRIKQFEKASRAVLFDENSKLTDIAYDANYYDQAHFSRSFKKFTRESPKNVRNKKSALKSHMEYE